MASWAIDRVWRSKLLYEVANIIIIIIIIIHNIYILLILNVYNKLKFK